MTVQTYGVAGSTESGCTITLFVADKPGAVVLTITQGQGGGGVEVELTRGERLHLANLLLRMPPPGRLWHLARCETCGGMVVPFDNEYHRDVWAVAHSNGNDHPVDVYEEER